MYAALMYSDAAEHVADNKAAFTSLANDTNKSPKEEEEGPELLADIRAACADLAQSLKRRRKRGQKSQKVSATEKNARPRKEAKEATEWFDVSTPVQPSPGSAATAD